MRIYKLQRPFLHFPAGTIFYIDEKQPCIEGDFLIYSSKGKLYLLRSSDTLPTGSDLIGKATATRVEIDT